jgi:hypothetical protein
MAQESKPWRSEDSVVVLASYLSRPRGLRLPPEMEIDRVADVLRVGPSRVRERMQSFSRLDRGDADGLPTPRDRLLWERYSDDPPRCAVEAEWILAGRKWRPAWLFKDAE